MADLSIPLAIAAPIAVAMSAAIGAIWARLTNIEKAHREKEIAWAVREQELLGRNEDLSDRITREVKRGAYLYAMTALEPPKQAPELPPSPEWEENTDIRNFRRQAELEALYRAYRESTPPKGYRGKLPTHRD